MYISRILMLHYGYLQGVQCEGLKTNELIFRSKYRNRINEFCRLLEKNCHFYFISIYYKKTIFT